ncbi:hypothetical protein QRX60_25140 [Amycolatopsis mongoliensis]|uniref:Uncharacterized protein n=1 Tax=Amycolatopsis mongoliensis TaxID=715475 RepID=A0A9Y2K1T2_9PSEU|nr:hypothetical protein [Amycolatopsis sp. 4-36]WIY06979.1 hypothetical protein QRX60_25140 [Amycolatopsis sp. 4-36]
MTKGKLTTGLAVVAVLVAAFVIGPFAVFTGAVWGLVAFCREYARRCAAEDVRGGPGLRYHLAAFGVLYLVPVGVAATSYLMLSAYLQWFADTSSTGWLISLQRFFEAVSQYFSGHLKLSEFSVFAALIGVYLLTCLLLARGDGGRRTRVAAGLGRTADLYTKYSGPAAAGLATLASLSLFGMQLGVPATDLQVKFKVAQQGYADVTRKIEAGLAQRVAGQLYGKVEAAFPQAYRDALAGRRTELAGLVDGARTSAAAAKSGYDVSLPAVDDAVRAEAVAEAKVDALEPELRVGEARPRDAPPGITPEQVAAARAVVDARPAEPGIDLVADSRKKVSLQVEKVASERIVALTKPVTDAVPILEPLVQAFAEAADKTLQDRLGRAYDRLADIALRAPRDFGAAVDREAAALVDHTDVTRPVAAATPRAEEVTRAFQATVSALRAAPGQLDRKVTEVIEARTPPPSLDPSGRLRLTFPELEPLRLPMPPLDYYRLPSYPYSSDLGRYGYGTPRYTPPDTFRVPPEIARIPRIAPPPRVSMPRIFVW